MTAARVHQATQAHIAQTDASVEWRGDEAIVDARAGRGDASLIRQHRRFELIELRLGQRLGLEQFLAALVLAAAVRARPLPRRRDRRVLRVLSSSTSTSPFADLLAFLETDRQ